MAFCFAHRGYSADAPENTMPAFELAVKRGADGIETDVHLTADGRLALIHDERLLRTTGQPGWVGEKTMTELSAMDAGSWYDDAFASAGIPELCQLLELLKPASMVLNIELKNSYRRYPGLEQAVLKELSRFRMLDRIVFSSFNHASMALVRELEPKAETALLYDCVLHETAQYALRCGVNSLHPMRMTVDEALVQECHQAGLTVRPWTVNSPAEAKRLLALGVDALISDCPNELNEE